MKTWMLALSLVAVLGFTALADAKGTKGAKHGHGIKGTITSVNGATFTMTTGVNKKKANAAVQTYTVDSSSASVTGGTLSVGAKVSVVGSQSGEKITASTIKIAGKHHKKKKSV